MSSSVSNSPGASNAQHKYNVPMDHEPSNPTLWTQFKNAYEGAANRITSLHDRLFTPKPNRGKVQEQINDKILYSKIEMMKENPTNNLEFLAETRKLVDASKKEIAADFTSRVSHFFGKMFNTSTTHKLDLICDEVFDKLTPSDKEKVERLSKTKNSDVKLKTLGSPATDATKISGTGPVFSSPPEVFEVKTEESKESIVMVDIKAPASEVIVPLKFEELKAPVSDSIIIETFEVDRQRGVQQDAITSYKATPQNPKKVTEADGTVFILTKGTVKNGVMQGVGTRKKTEDGGPEGGKFVKGVFIPKR